ncbi:unnamed protein product [Ilex paraguariensis]|uniref:BZIP domain-containing protein n=1 Tax=Ilex paraguariensis TaxID=185542 RepID=A0ABC8RYW7_9AQUA
MENGPNINASTVDSSVMNSLGQRKQAGSIHDIMNRRLKNRERQRRYRARKRREADIKKAGIGSQSTPLQVEIQVNSTSHDGVTRIHCQRDWKKDARRAHVVHEQEIKSSDPASLEPTSVSGSEAPFLPSRFGADPPSSSETPRTTLSKRHWKAEARNKKS